MDKILDMKRVFEREQDRLFARICLENRVAIQEIRTIAGVDLAYWKENDKEYACCCIVLVDFHTLSIIERKYCVDEITVPYIPGCLAVREFGLVEKTVKTLEREVDLYVFDGNGYLHPKHMGLATHAGIILAKPSIGVAKSFYKFADVEYAKPNSEAFSYTDIVINGETYGRVLRTHENVKPIFLSIGNMIDLETATEIIKKLVTKESHIPVPTRFADIMTHEIRRDYYALI